MTTLILIAGVVFGVLVVLPMIVASFLRNVEAGTIRLVSWLAGGTVIYRGPGKSKEIPLLTTGTTISSKVINVDLDITDQTADLDAEGTPRPIKVRVLASAIVSVGDSDEMIKTAEPLLLQGRWGPALDPHRPPLELGAARDQPPHPRPALLGAHRPKGASRVPSDRRCSRRHRRPGHPRDGRGGG